MAVRSNIATVSLGKQSAKGTPATVFDFRTRLSSDDRIAPRAEHATFAETDGSRDAPDSEKLGGGVEGAFQHGVRDSFFHKIAEAALGTKVSSGTTNYTHTVTGADALSYYTARSVLGDLLWEESTDLIVNEWAVNAEAGGFLTSQLGFMGRAVTRATAAFATPPAIASDAVYNFNNATVSLGGAASALVRSFSLTVTNNVQLLQHDDFVPYDAYVGQREVTVGFDILLDDLAHYNAFHYGSAVGTAQSGTTYTTDLNFLFSKGVNNSIEFDFDSVNYEEFPVGQDTGGDPIYVSVRARARRNATGLVKVVTKNQTAT